MIFFAVFACDGSDHLTTVKASGVATNSTQANDGIIRDSVSIAFFEDDTLDRCLVYTFFVVSEPRVQERLDSAVAELRRQADSFDGATPINMACQKQFSDRTMLAGCLIQDITDGKNLALQISLQTFYYSYASVGRSDKAMKECLDSGGKWDAIDHKSRAFIRARMDYHARGYESVLDPE